MKFKCDCSWIWSYWDTSISIRLGLVSGCFLLHQGRVKQESIVLVISKTFSGLLRRSLLTVALVCMTKMYHIAWRFPCYLYRFERNGIICTGKSIFHVCLIITISTYIPTCPCKCLAERAGRIFPKQLKSTAKKKMRLKSEVWGRKEQTEWNLYVLLTYTTCLLMDQLLWTVLWQFLKRLKMDLWYGTSSSNPRYLSEKYKTQIWKEICTPLFITAFFTITKPRCPKTDEWVMKIWVIHTMAYYSAI